MTHPLDLDAHQLSAALHAGALSCRELMAATLARIAALNPRFNAVVNLADGDDLLRQADAADAELAQGRSRGFLHGMPLAIKDAADAVGFPTTKGSLPLKDARPAEDGLVVQRMKAAGAIVIGKTNVPEFGLGSHTYNPVFGPTCNAWDPTRTAGGSSGGAAVGLALRLFALADGSDFMGSLRNPAGWNHVLGLRPSQGRVPAWPRPDQWVSQLATEGPMARTVRDLARLLDIQAGYDARTPLSLDDAGGSFVPAPDAAERGLQGLRVGWLGDLGGHLPTEAGVLACCEAALARMAGGGADVAPARLAVDLAQVWQAWLMWRRALVAPVVGAALALPGAREVIKPEALWEHDQAQSLDFNTFMNASVVRTSLQAAFVGLFERFDVLALPTAQVWPFAIEQTWPREVAGRPMDTYHRWMEVTIYATFAGLPAMSVPAGFDAGGRWPMGLQLIGPPRADAALLRAAAGYEARLEEALASRRPAALAAL
jgi:amidase